MPFVLLDLVAGRRVPELDQLVLTSRQAVSSPSLSNGKNMDVRYIAFLQRAGLEKRTLYLTTWTAPAWLERLSESRRNACQLAMAERQRRCPSKDARMSQSGRGWSRGSEVDLALWRHRLLSSSCFLSEATVRREKEVSRNPSPKLVRTHLQPHLPASISQSSDLDLTGYAHRVAQGLQV